MPYGVVPRWEAGSPTPQKRKLRPTPAAKSIEIQLIVENSGRSESRPRRIFPYFEKAKYPTKRRKPVTARRYTHPKLEMT